MNIKDYISSGIVEAYVLGIATEVEVREIEQLMKLHPELEVIVRDEEDVLLQYILENASAPPAQLKQKIWSALSVGTEDSVQAKNINSTPISASSSNSPKPSWYKYAMAASLALLVASAVANMWLMNQNKKINNQVVAIEKTKELLNEEKKSALASAQQSLDAIRVLSLPKLVKINLAGVGTHTNHSGMLYWDGGTGDVYVDLNGMPKAPDGKQYQLWAIVDGSPVDAGMYDGNEVLAMHKMKTIPKAEMFAITIENAGGSATPTLDQMVVAGKTS